MKIQRPSLTNHSPGEGDSKIGLAFPGARPLPLPLPPPSASNSAFLLLPNDTPQLLARLASRLLALALGPTPAPVPDASGLDGAAVAAAAAAVDNPIVELRDGDRKSTRLNSSHSGEARMPSSA